MSELSSVNRVIGSRRSSAIC